MTRISAAGGLSGSGGGGMLPVTFVAGITQTMVAGNAYVNDNAGVTIFTLPVTCAAGEYMAVFGNAGLWVLTQNAGQSVKYGNAESTAGAGGTISARDPGDSLWLLCLTANTVFKVIAGIGNVDMVAD